jgi:hypothetical protein
MSNISGKFITPELLYNMTLVNIKKHVRELNEHYGLKGYSKLKKDQLINQIATAQERIKKGSRKPTVKAKLTVSKKDLHPKGIHMHIQWKDGEKELKQYKTQKQGESAFKKIRAERKTKRDYRTLKLMDGKKPIEYSA